MTLFHSVVLRVNNLWLVIT